MALIQPAAVAANNPQLVGIGGIVPMPNGNAGQLPSGTPFHFTNAGMTLGGQVSAGYSIVDSTAAAAAHAAATGVGAGAAGTAGAAQGAAAATPAAGAQPALPASGATGAAMPAVAGTTVAGTPTTAITPAVAAAAGGGAGAAPTGSAAAVSGFGAAERGKPMVAGVDGATFRFPSFKQSARSNAAPAIAWGPGWTRVNAGGMHYMQHANGTKAVPATEYRVTPSPADKVQTIAVGGGWGKKFPDGSVLVFDRAEGPYRLDPSGAKHKVAPGTHTIGGVKVRVFEVAVVRTLEPGGQVTVFDSRGQHKAGTNRSRLAGALGTAGGGATQTPGTTVAGSGSGAVTQSGPVTQSGLVTQSGMSVAQVGNLTNDVQQMTAHARRLIDQIRSGTVDAAGLASLQAQLAKLPAGVLQAAGAAGAMPGTAVAGANGAGVSGAPTPASAGAATGGGTTVAASGGAAAPTPGRDVQGEAVKQLAAGTTATIAGVTVPADMVGKQARFAQLPEELQRAVAAAFGSELGSMALKPDTLVAFPSGSTASLVEAEQLQVRNVSQVRGAGPGEDLALTLRPSRQPNSAASGASATGGGSTGAAHSTSHAHANAPGGGAAAAAASGAVGTTPGVAGGRPVVSTGGAATRTRVPLLAAGSTVRDVKLGGLDGSYTWATMPAAGRTAIVNWLKAHPSHPAGKAFASATGSGWAIDPGARITLTSGMATFLDGLALRRSAAPAVGGGGAAPADPAAHDATRPPGTGAAGATGGGSAIRPPGSGVGTVPPGTAPPVPVAGGGAPAGGHGVGGHAH